MKKNKYEDIEMLDLEDKVEDILDIYVDCLFSTDKTVGIIANKTLVEYILDCLIRYDETSVKEIDLVDYMNINEYILSVNDDGYITCVPIEDFGVLDDTDIFYIDMDGSIKQDIIDYCVNEDKEVILFGQKDDECDGDCENCSCETKLSTTATYKVNGKEVSEKEYNKALDNFHDRYMDGIASMLLGYSEFIDEMNEWKKLFNW